LPCIAGSVFKIHNYNPTCSLKLGVKLGVIYIKGRTEAVDATRYEVTGGWTQLQNK
jgi:hypothetical protein